MVTFDFVLVVVGFKGIFENTEKDSGTKFCALWRESGLESVQVGSAFLWTLK